MKKTAVIVAIAIIAIIVASVCACAAKVDAPAATVSEITVSGNPSTGCSWVYKFDADGIVAEPVVKTETETSELAGGTVEYYTYTLSGVKEGTTNLYMRYGHSWADNEYYEVHKFVCTVDSKLNVTCVEVVPDEACVVLEGSPTTGYCWYIDSTSEIVNVLNYIYIQDAAEPEMVGVGGTFYFPVVGVTPGTCTLSFNYVAPDGVTVDQTISYNLTVADDLTVTITE